MNDVRMIDNEKKPHRFEMRFQVAEKENGFEQSPSHNCFQVEKQVISATSFDVEFFSSAMRDKFAKEMTKFAEKLRRLDSVKSFERNALFDSMIEIFEEMKKV